MYMLRVSCLKLEIKEVRCYEAKIEESESGGSSQVSWVRLPVAPGLFTFLYFRLITSNFLYNVHVSLLYLVIYRSEYGYIKWCALTS